MLCQLIDEDIMGGSAKGFVNVETNTTCCPPFDQRASHLVIAISLVLVTSFRTYQLWSLWQANRLFQMSNAQAGARGTSGR